MGDTDQAVESSGEEKAAERAKAGQQTEAEKQAAVEAQEPWSARVARVLEAYTHALEHGAPRTQSELDELKALFHDVQTPAPAPAVPDAPPAGGSDKSAGQSDKAGPG